VDTSIQHATTPGIAEAFRSASTQPAGRHRERWKFAPVLNAQRESVECFIRDGFRQAYQARIDACLPILMALHRNRELVAACGLNHAAARRLFLEIYLDAPVERVLSTVSRTSTAREDIVEVGNLTVARPGFARQLIVHLTSHLHARGPAWVVFSAVPQLRNNFIRLGIPLLHLAMAKRERLPAVARDAWGTYYDGAPQVTAVKVAAAHAALAERRCIP
jgi:hypothetical protein